LNIVFQHVIGFLRIIPKQGVTVTVKALESNVIAKFCLQKAGARPGRLLIGKSPGRVILANSSSIRTVPGPTFSSKLV
jgi:hypothetical protein